MQCKKNEEKQVRRKEKMKRKDEKEQQQKTKTKTKNWMRRMKKEQMVMMETKQVTEWVIKELERE